MDLHPLSWTFHVNKCKFIQNRFKFMELDWSIWTFKSPFFLKHEFNIHKILNRRRMHKTQIDLKFFYLFSNSQNPFFFFFCLSFMKEFFLTNYYLLLYDFIAFRYENFVFFFNLLILNFTLFLRNLTFFNGILNFYLIKILNSNILLCFFLSMTHASYSFPSKFFILI
jgi:hypothetical protein